MGLTPSQSADLAQYPEPVETMDLTGVPCPINSSRVIIKMELMEPGEVLTVVIDDGEPIANVPVTLAQEGHEVVGCHGNGDQWTLTVVRGEDV